MSESPEPSSFLRGTDEVLDLFSKICLILAGTALVAMTLMFAWLVYGRYVLNDTPTWVEQVSHLADHGHCISWAQPLVYVKTPTSVGCYFRTIVPSWVRTIFVFVTDILMAGFGGLCFGTDLN